MIDRLVRCTRRMSAKAAKVAAAAGLDMNLCARVSDLSVADGQMVANARTLARHPMMPILDEPT